MDKTLLDIKKGEIVEVAGFGGGSGLGRRLEAMGIRPGKVISRVSSQLMGGPVIVSVDGRHTAMGRGMAGKVRVIPHIRGLDKQGE